MSLALKIFNKNKYIFSAVRITYHGFLAPVPKINIQSCFCSEAKTLDIKPPKYTTSKAAQWKASESLYGEETDEPWYQMHIVALSTTIFLIYFCILREENDIDEKIYQPLVFPIPNPKDEESNLRAKIEELKSQGKDYKLYQERLMVLEKK